MFYAPKSFEDRAVAAVGAVGSAVYDQSNIQPAGALSIQWSRQTAAARPKLRVMGSNMQDAQTTPDSAAVVWRQCHEVELTALTGSLEIAAPPYRYVRFVLMGATADEAGASVYPCWP